MKKDTKIECNTCHKEKPIREIKRIGNIWRCKSCVRERRWANREYLKRDVLGIRKRKDLLKEWQEKRNLRQLVPKIAGSKSRSISRQLHFYITKEEKYFLYKKYILNGLDSFSARDKVKNDVKFLSDLITRLREKKKTDAEIDRHFKEEFSKLVMSE